MADTEIMQNPEFRDAFLANERRERISTGKIASALVVFLMPAGISLDWFVYRDEVPHFLLLRLLCSALVGVIWLLHTTRFGERNYKALGLPIALLPALSIALMIYAKEGPTSPYYAGLNLILLAVSVVVHWGVFESILAVGCVMLMYSAAAIPQATSGHLALIFNNYYFLLLTGIIVVTGNYFFNRLRFREFALRFELDKKNTVLESTIKKLTEAEIQLVQSEKLASLGRMSAGIIHEINNPLNFATTGLYTLRNKAKHLPAAQQDEYKEILAEVEEGVGRVKNIVSDLRMFTHPDTERLDEFEAGEAVTSALRFLSNEFRDRAQVVKNLPEKLVVSANKNKLIQVVINLVQNSLDALKNGSPTGDPATIWIEGKTGPEKNLLIVRDNGPGIAPEHLGKIFDPFYTTKDVGEGMGLGLSICYRIMHESGGQILVKTEPGKFCEITLEFPAKG